MKHPLRQRFSSSRFTLLYPMTIPLIHFQMKTYSGEKIYKRYRLLHNLFSRKCVDTFAGYNLFFYYMRDLRRMFQSTV